MGASVFLGWREWNRTTDPYRVKNVKPIFQHLRESRRMPATINELYIVLKNKEIVAFRVAGIHNRSRRVFDAILTRYGSVGYGKDQAQRES